MKKGTVCKVSKHVSHFGKYTRDRNRCNHCYAVIAKNNKAEIQRNKEARIEAYATGEMPVSDKRDIVYVGCKIKIENKLIEREHEKQLKDLEL